MRKYNLSAIMKRAWVLVKQLKITISEALKKSWKETKNTMKDSITLNVSGKETFTVNTVTGEISGKTYNSKEWIKRNFDAKWNPDKKAWVAAPETIKKEFENTRYYSLYIVSDDEDQKVNDDNIIRTELVNRNDGFYSKNTHVSGKVTYTFVG